MRGLVVSLTVAASMAALVLWVALSGYVGPVEAGALALLLAGLAFLAVIELEKETRGHGPPN